MLSRLFAHLSTFDQRLAGFRSLPELSPGREQNAYLRRYKRSRLLKWAPTMRYLQELSALQAYLLLLNRSSDVVTLTLEMSHLVSPDEIAGWEAFQEEVLSLGIYAGSLDGRMDGVERMLAIWRTPGPVVGRERRGRIDVEFYSRSDPATAVDFLGLDKLRGARLSSRLYTIARWWLWLITDRIILGYQLPGVRVLEEAGVTEATVLRFLAVVQPKAEELLERKRLECERWFSWPFASEEEEHWV